MKKILLITLVLLTAQTLKADPSVSNIVFRHLTTENGLSSNMVRAMTQDSYGYIWIGTDEGLNRYDGTCVKYYKRASHNNNEAVSSLYATADHLYIGGDDGVYVFDYASETTTFFNIPTAEGTTISSVTSHITEDKDHNLWFTSVGQGIFRYNPATQELKQYIFRDINGLMASVLVDSQNQIWAVSNWGEPSLYRLNKADDRFEAFTLRTPDGKPYSFTALAMTEDAEQNLWIGTWDCGLLRVDKYNGQVTTYLHPNDSKGTTHIHSIIEYAPHQLFIGSDDGLLSFNTLNGKHQLFIENENDRYSLSNRFVYPLVKDHEGGLWIGSYYGGVDYVSPATGQFENYVQTRNGNSVNGIVISNFCEDNDGHIWIASDDGGLNCFDPITKHFEHYLPKAGRNSLSYHNVHALCLDGDNLWIGTYTGGVDVLNIPTGRFKNYTARQNDSSTLDGSSTYCIFKDREERIWVATMTGINLYNREKDNFTRVRTIDALTIDIDQDADGNLWLATEGKGIFRYNPTTGTWKNYSYSDDSHHSLPNNQVNSLLIDSGGTIWAATMDGLCKYNAEKDRFDSVKLDIPNQHICGIIEDQHFLWITTRKGLVRYKPGDGCQMFLKNDGLQSEQFMPNAALKASDGKIYIGSTSGFCTFYPHQIKTNQVVPRVVITGLEINSKPVSVGDKVLPQAPNRLEELNLSYGENAFSLTFASLSYCDSQKNRYAYMLEGFDKDWKETNGHNRATYTNVPPGKYVFRVKATNNDGVWNEEGASLTIIIHPPFYWTTLAKLLYILLIAIGIFFLVRLALKRAEKKHQAQMDELSEKKEAEMHEAKISFFTVVAHEIRTPVSLIIGPLEKIMRGGTKIPKAIMDDLEIIDSNSKRLLFLINQLLDFRKVEQADFSLRFASVQLCPLLKALCERFDPTIRQHGATLTVNYPPADFAAVIDSEMVTKLVSNLLTNACKYTSDKVVLSSSVAPDGQHFTISVQDNGIGISEEEKQKIFLPFYQSMENKPGTGIGLSIVKRIVEQHHGEIDVQSKPGQGSTFIVTLPVTQPQENDSEKPLGDEASAEDPHDGSVPDGILQETSLTQNANQKPVMLIVDDHLGMLNFLSGNFREHYSVVTATDGKEALEKLRTNEVTLIISDWMMPGMNGVDLCKAVRANQDTSHIPFILLTAKTDTRSKIEGTDCGADAYIEKPFSVQYLEACIKNLIDLRNLLRRKFSKMPLVPINSIASSRVDDKLLTRMGEIIEENFSNEDLSVDFLAEKLGISRSSLFAKIKTLASVTPNEMIQIVRLKKAAILLSEHKYRVNEVCYMVGFSSPSYFSKCFQKQFGMKPSDFENETKTK